MFIKSWFFEDQKRYHEKRVQNPLLYSTPKRWIINTHESQHHMTLCIYVSTYIYYCLFLCTHTKQQKLHNDDDSSAYLLSQVVLLESNDQRDHMAPAGIATAHDAIASGIPTVLLSAVSGWWPKGLMLVAQIVGKSSIGHALI